MNKTLLGLFLTLSILSCSRSKPVAESEHPPRAKGPELVEMTLEAQKHAGLEVAPAQLTELNEHLQVVGTVQPIDSRVAHVRPLANGRLHDVLAKVGDRVKAGQALATFDNIDAGELASQYQTAKAELERIKVQQAVSMKQAERNRRLVEIGAVPQKEYEASKAEQEAFEASIKAQESVLTGLATRLRRFGVADAGSRNSSFTTIRSPFAGVVMKAPSAPGEAVDAQSELFQIADLSQVWVQAEVYEKDLARVGAGQMATVLVDTYPGQRFEGKVTYVGDILDPQTRTVKVRCEVSNPGTKLKLDMFASVNLPTTFSRRALAVPNAAIQQLENKNVVFVRKAQTQFEVREIKPGKAVGENTEILSGLVEGEPVVTNGAFHLKSIVLSGQRGEEE